MNNSAHDKEDDLKRPAIESIVDTNSQTNLNDGKKETKATNGIRSIMSILTDEAKRPEPAKSNGVHPIDSVMMNFLNEVKSFQQLVVTAKEFAIDAEELFWLKMVSLFRVNTKDGQMNTAKFAALHEHSQLMLGLCVARKLNTEPSAQTIRLGQLTFVLSLLASISESTVESLFFRKTIGNLSVVNLIQDLFNSSHLESFS